MTGRSDARRSRAWMQEALIQLMERKPFKSITITDIAERAGVSRLTFYRNYDSKEAVLEAYFDQLFQSYLESIKNDRSPSLNEALCRCFEYWQKHAKESRLLVQNDLASLIHRPFGAYLDEVMQNVNPPLELSSTQKRFIVGGLFFTMLDWIDQGAAGSPEEVTNEILRLIPAANPTSR